MREMYGEGPDNHTWSAWYSGVGLSNEHVTHGATQRNAIYNFSNFSKVNFWISRRKSTTIFTHRLFLQQYDHFKSTKCICVVQNDSRPW